MKRRSESTFALFDIVYTDGSQSSNRKVLTSVLEGLDGAENGRAAIEAQDRERAQASGRAQGVIATMVRKRS
jgi:hypothetical protein